jgi:hypothetical protein
MARRMFSTLASKVYVPFPGPWDKSLHAKIKSLLIFHSNSYLLVYVICNTTEIHLLWPTHLLHPPPTITSGLLSLLENQMTLSL